MCATNRVLRGLAAVFVCGFTPLFSGCLDASGTFFNAIRQEDVATAKRLLKANPSLANAEDSDGESGLNMAVEHNNAEIVKLLIDAGADVNHDCSRLGLPLHAAAYYGQIEIAKLLLEAGADPSIQTAVPSHSAGETALHNAAFGGSPEAVELLLEHGADVNAKAESEGNETPLYFPLGPGRGDLKRLDVIRILLERGADVNARDDDAITPLARLRKNKASFEGRELDPREFDFSKAEELLLEYGAKE